MTKKDRAFFFVWQHLWLLVSLYFMTLGVALTIRSDLGSSVISSIPMAVTLAGGAGMAPPLSVGEYTNIMNVVLVLVQLLVLRRRFEPVQLLQLVAGTVFGTLLDLNMALTAPLAGCASVAGCAAMQLGGCVVLGVAVAFEVRCGSVTMPGEGVPAAISRATGMPFAKAKIITDICLVAGAVALGYAFFGRWITGVVGPGTLFAMVFVGVVVRFTDCRIGWFGRLLHCRPGFRRYLYGLARHIRR
ncbi:MAG: hypothetical protein K2L76_04935 [Muribaculaceae bacterium]|nr:hypothetical protein [Muribaculaceae bacterium]